MEKQVLYDVCNDYTLEVAEQAINLVGEYTQYELPNGILYKHTEYDEIHYFKGKEGLTGKVLFEVTG